MDSRKQRHQDHSRVSRQDNKRASYTTKTDMKTTRETLQKACYQYLLDHSIPVDGKTIVTFQLLSESEFARRVRAREKGYKRVYEEDIEKNPMKVREKLPFVKHAKKTVARLKKGEQKALARQRLKKEGGFITKCVFLLRELCDVYINKKLSTTPTLPTDTEV